jgi:uncharacterized spore protein YtfJ
MASVEVDDDKYEILSIRAEEKGFDSTEEYIDDLLEQIVQKISREEENREYTEEEEEKVKEKLQQLGYLE